MIDEMEARSLHPWPVVVVGSPSLGYQLFRKIGEEPQPLKGATLKEATCDAMLVGIRCGGEFDEIFLPLPRERPADVEGFVYFVAGDEGPVKIGFAVSPKLRLQGLQTGSPIRLTILATAAGTIDLEREYHRRFAAHRLHGEWFERHPDILAEIERLTHG